jgi:glycosyltransferase involved in cell wall biosynthesis
MPLPSAATPRPNSDGAKSKVQGPRKRQLLVDVTHTSLHDFKTGIQRVVRGLLFELIQHSPEGYQVEAVYTPAGGQGFLYAREFLERLGLRPKGADSPVQVRSGDVLLVPENNYDAVLKHPENLQALRRAGVKTYSIIYDLIPITLPHAFSPAITLTHARWLAKIAEGDGLICISRAVADEVVAWLDLHGPQRKQPLPVGWFHLGADLEGSLPSRGLPEDAAATLAVFRAKPTFLMVGTLEPRKSHRQVMEAFDLLWARGLDINLVFVGREGWRVEKLTHQLRHTHPERNQRLFWIEGGSDEYLAEIYATTSCLLFPSQAEGFGLPLIEAAQHGLPILARDIPVFREVAGDHACYFEGSSAEALAERIEGWLAAREAKKLPDSRNMPWLTWEQSAQSLRHVILEGNWYTAWELAASRPSSRARLNVTIQTWERTIGVDARILWTEDHERAAVREYTRAHLESLAAARTNWRFQLVVDEPPHTPGELTGLLERPNVEVCAVGDVRMNGLDLLHYPELSSGSFQPLGKNVPEGLATTAVVRTLASLATPTSGGRELRLFRRRGRALLTTSEAIRQRLLAVTELKAGDLETVSEGCTLSPPVVSGLDRVLKEWGFAHPFFLINGELSPEHDMDMVLTAFKTLVAARPAHLLILGGLGNRKMQLVRKQAKAFGIEQLRFSGDLDARELAVLHHGATAFLHPGLSASFPSPALRAMSMGCPVIGFPEGALPEVAGDAAIYVPTGSVLALVGAMKKLMDHPELRETLRTRGLHRAGRFAWEVVAEQTIQCWDRLWGSSSDHGGQGHQSGTGQVLVRWEGAFLGEGMVEGLRAQGLHLEWTADSCSPRKVPEASVHVRHHWPLDLAPPASGCWVVSLPEGAGPMDATWSDLFQAEVDEVWVPDSATREHCLAAGIPPERIWPPESGAGVSSGYQEVADRLATLAGRKPRRLEFPRPVPQPRGTALIYRVDWREAEWIEIVLAFVSAFEPTEAVALALEISWDDRVPTMAAAERRILDLISRVKKVHFPQIMLVGPDDSLEKTLEGFPIRETIPHGRGPVDGLATFVGLRFAGTRMELTRS